MRQNRLADRTESLSFSLYSVHRYGCRPNEPGHSDVRHERQLVSTVVESARLADTMQHDLPRRGGLPAVLHRGFRPDQIFQLRSHDWIAALESGLQHMHPDGEELLRDSVHGVCGRR